MTPTDNKHLEGADYTIPVIRESVDTPRGAQLLLRGTHHNAAAEGLTSKIQTIKKMVYGYRNHEHFTAAIFFHFGGLQRFTQQPRDSLLTSRCRPLSARTTQNDVF
jgi:hypothetical protein